ncbi:MULTISPECIES: hypothetical protein [unclassified Streptomyces]|uniref:hypothetical protein n=1 Tax=unclassified Streptomyces TaxID=2593676 RepID=UPI003863314E|nr:hypothetical protein OG569_01305 [Streptomyces sp. NBC_00827]
MTVRRRTGSVVLGLLVALATVLGVACLCTHGPAVQPVAAMSSAASHGPDGDDHEHVCAAPGEDECGAQWVMDTPTTGPGPHPQPQSLPAQVHVRPAAVPAQTTAYGVAPRPPNLHVLQVLRT